MTEKEVVRNAMKVRGYNQAMLAELCGFRGQTNVSEYLRRKNMSVASMLKMLNAMGFDVVVKDRNGSNKDNVWKLTPNDEESTAGDDA